MPRIPKNPYKLLRIRWLDACQHNNAEDDSEGVVRDTVGYLVRDTGSVIRLAGTVDWDASGDGSWVPSTQDDITDIPLGMVMSRRKYG